MKTSSPRLRAVWFTLSLILLILAVTWLMDESRRAKRSKVEPLTPAEVVSIRPSKNSGYAKIRFSNPEKRGPPVCFAEIALGPHYRATNVGDTIFVYVDRSDCAAPVWPKYSTDVFHTFLACLVLLVLTISRAAKLIAATQAARRETQVTPTVDNE